MFPFPGFSKFDLDPNTQKSFRSVDAACEGEALWARVEGVVSEPPFGGAQGGKFPSDSSDALAPSASTREDEGLLDRLQAFFRKAA